MFVLGFFFVWFLVGWFWFHLVLGLVLIGWLVFEKAVCIYLEVFIYTSLPLTALCENKRA